MGIKVGHHHPRLHPALLDGQQVTDPLPFHHMDALGTSPSPALPDEFLLGGVLHRHHVVKGHVNLLGAGQTPSQLLFQHLGEPVAEGRPGVEEAALHREEVLLPGLHLGESRRPCQNPIGIGFHPFPPVFTR